MTKHNFLIKNCPKKETHYDTEYGQHVKLPNIEFVEFMWTLSVIVILESQHEEFKINLRISKFRFDWSFVSLRWRREWEASLYILR